MTVWILTLVDYRGRRNVLGVYSNKNIAEKHREDNIKYHNDTGDYYGTNDYDLVEYKVIGD